MTILINDIREDFKNVSFSGYQKSKVKKQLLNSLLNSKIENACYWTAELISAGHYIDIWELILIYISKYIHLGNPKLIIYLNIRYNFFKKMINSYTDKELSLRNNNNIRELFCEIICIVIGSNKKYEIIVNKINENLIKDITELSSRLKAPNTNYILNYFTDDDPKELFIALNELIYSIEIKSFYVASFWIEWILQFEQFNNKKRKHFNCKIRNIGAKSFEKDIIWLIWEIILDYAKKKNNLTLKIIESILEMFKIRYKNSSKRKRKMLIYYALIIVIENYDSNIKINNLENTDNIIKNIDKIYKDIKKNEVSPNTDYLFNNLKVKNIEKSLYKLNVLNDMMKNNSSNDSDEED